MCDVAETWPFSYVLMHPVHITILIFTIFFTGDKLHWLNTEFELPALRPQNNSHTASQRHITPICIIKTGSAQTTQNNAVCIFLRTFNRGNKWTVADIRETNDTDKI